MITLLASLRVLVVFTVLTGGLYPLLVWAVGQAAFRAQAEGSLVEQHGRVVGSTLLAQKTASPRYFAPRPSAADFATVASGASSQSWTNSKFAAALAERRTAFAFAVDVPADLLTASASGLDPELSPAAVRLQAERVAAARNLDAAQRRQLDELIAAHTSGGQLSPARVNLLQLNLALDAALP